MRARKHIALVLALSVLPGCKGCKEESAAPAGPTPDASAREASMRSGVKVNLPDGWSGQVASDDSVQAGPPGRPVLRVDLRRGQGAKKPSADELADRVRAELKGYEVSLDQEEETEGYTLLRVTMAPKLADGGLGLQTPGFFGARRLGDDLFLCASLPGASPEEVLAATEACRKIELQSAPR
ncbi:hypothetical protein JY651_41045 [Pyxidicoccus parkwayensis]|uniref:Lipoprotein n=1 Tax=Pyxidicoccus parkwayensis TaxID=2813578 RepID=A0ABX7NSR8_9BACT|nr:hypothetical protein [Pyxidicoccus parkwaysis]QSQ21508.1 hypothetical protein JY651_41045 [Pyxidicoccus parkwaysis]